MKVFVYGSLKKGYWNNGWLGDSELVAEATTVEPVILTDCGFPYMIDPESVPEGPHKAIPAPVVGEVYEVNDEAVMWDLDALEGVPTHYQRRLIDVRGICGTVMQCAAYFSASPELDVERKLCQLNEEGNYVWRD